MLETLARWRDRAPAARAAEEAGVPWSVTTLLQHAESTATWLHQQGVRAGDRVAWHGPSSLDFARVLLGTWRLDATYVGINPRYTAREIEDVTSRTAPRLVVTPSRLGDADASGNANAPLPPATGEHPAVLVFTTGSTGRPKIAVLSHRGIAAASGIQATQMFSGPRRTINALPANHIGGIVNITTATWWGQQAVEFVPVFTPEAITDCLARSGHARLAAVPMLFRRCLDDPTFVSTARGRLIHALSGGAPLPRGIHDELRALGAEVQGMYGQSETSGSVCFTGLHDDAATTCETVGRPPQGIDLRLGPIEGHPGSRTAGEVQVRGPQVFDGYLDDPEATQAAFTADGWLRTGDLAERRPDGTIRLTGRLKELINTGGHKVMPAEVEGVLQAHPDVRTAVVIPVADGTFGEVVAAVLVMRDGVPLASAALDAWCRTQLANYKIPKRWHMIDTLPLLGVGKVDRRALIARFSPDQP